MSLLAAGGIKQAGCGCCGGPINPGGSKASRGRLGGAEDSIDRGRGQDSQEVNPVVTLVR